MKTAIIAITGNGAQIGARLRKGLEDSDLYVPEKCSYLSGCPATVYRESLKSLVAKLWRETEGLVCIMAAGIVVRIIAPLLEGKDKDPAVVVMDDAGKFAVSLLSGHLGGANELAEKCARLAGATAVITTATDVRALPSFDMLAKEHGWAIDDLSRVKVLNTLLLEDAGIAVVDPSGLVERYFSGRGRLSFYPDFPDAIHCGAKGYLFVTNRILPHQILPPNLLIIRPRNLVLGIGCNSGTEAGEIETVVREKLECLSLSLKSVRCIATASAKRGEPGLLSFAGRYSLPITCFESSELNSIRTPSPPSRHSVKAIGAAGVAEPAALLASNGGKLLLKKVKSGNVTLAIAEIA